MTSSETKTCQNCKVSFVIDASDFAFYEAMHVPAPLWCPQCRLKRRLAWFGYRMLYKHRCYSTGDEVISSLHPDLPYKVYRQDIWWSDKWDPKSYGRDYDFSRPFFEQFDALMKEVPWPSLFTEYTTMVDSEYCNGAGTLKNCYLCFKSDHGENSAYANTTDHLKECVDVSFSYEMELCYDLLNCNKCYHSFYSQNCDDCHDVYFSKNLVGCSNCVGCVNLRNKNYHIFNEPYSKEEYAKKFKALHLGSTLARDAFRAKATQFILQHPQKAFYSRNTVDTSGDYIMHSKNVRDSYMVQKGENVRFGQLLKTGPSANCYDYTGFGMQSEWIYESTWVGINVNHIKFGFWDYTAHDLEYCLGCHSSENLFGCMGIRKGEYCILNKQYSKDEYKSMVENIKKQMTELPYKDSLGREHRYGDFFPAMFSPWAYNESSAIEFLPMDKEQAQKEGFKWRDPDPRDYQDATTEVPDRIEDIDEGITKEILKCIACGKNYRIANLEFAFYKKMKIPIPLKCPLCRDRERIGHLNPIAVYDRTCAKCGKEIQTSYAPDRPEIVYCEQCYQAEVV